MIEVSHFDQVVQIRMSREVNGRPLYWVAAYLVDGILIDTGCKHTSEEFVTVEKLLQIETDRLVLFTSIGVIVEDGREALRKFLDYIRELTQRVIHLNREGVPAAAIRDRIFGRESSLAQLTGGHYSSLNLILSILNNGPARAGQ